MNPKFKQPWVDALRSGEYLQTTGVLHNEHGYCCLGVLRDVCAKAGVLINADEDSELLDIHTACDLLGLDNSTQDGLAAMNDARRSFAEIADHIETTL